jgi:hypothetical protein
MGLRFHKSIRLMRGVRVNLGLRGASVSIGRPGMTYNIGAKGSRVTVGIPGTGLSCTQSVSHQNPVTLISNSAPKRRRYSATPLVIAALVLGLLYLATHTANSPKESLLNHASTDRTVDAVGTLSPGMTMPKPSSTDPKIPVPSPSARPRSEVIGPPLQFVPH